MRFLLLIPAFILLLSNVPFVQEISLDVAQEMMKGSDCNNETRKGSCRQSDNQESRKSSMNECCDKTEGTVICICCFQFAAPNSTITQFQFSSFFSNNCLTGFLDKNVKDPLIAAPWQPPDIM